MGKEATHTPHPPPWHPSPLSQPLSLYFPFSSARLANIRVMIQGCYHSRTVYRIKSQEQVGWQDLAKNLGRGVEGSGGRGFFHSEIISHWVSLL